VIYILSNKKTFIKKEGAAHGKKIAYIGIDYHLNSLTISVMVEGEMDFHQIIRLVSIS